MRKLITMLVCLAMAGGVYAQGRSIDIKKFTFGVKTGLNVSNLVGKDVKDDGANYKAGFHIGVVGELRASKIFVIAPEILFSMQGSQYKSDGYKVSLNSSYINIPIMARFYVVDFLSIEVGPQFGFATGMKGVVKLNDYKETEKFESKEDYAVFDFALGVGVTYNFKHKFFASARYNFGLTDVLKMNDPYRNKNSVFQLSVGYNIFSRD